METAAPSPVVNPPPLPPKPKPPLTPKQVMVLCIAGVVLLLFFLGAYSSRPPGELFPDQIINALLGAAWNVCTSVGGIICILVLSGLFYRFRTPPDRGTIDDGYELLERAVLLERKGKVEEALKAYEYVAARYSSTAAGQDAQKSIQGLRELR
jgi:hypothetical protein